jgi:anti-sigma regulatory factor (Ser/Thr protein kinase)
MPYYRCPDCGLTTHSVAGYSTIGMCASCGAPLPFEARLYPGVRHDRTRVLRAGLAAPAQARRMVATLPFTEGLRDALAMVLSELVTNSVRHAGVAAGDPIELHVTGDDRRLSVSVHDGGPGFSKPMATNGTRRAGGLGLKIVAALSDDWAVSCGPEGCTVRCAVEGWPATVGKRPNTAQNGALVLEEKVAQ